LGRVGRYSNQKNGWAQEGQGTTGDINRGEYWLSQTPTTYKLSDHEIREAIGQPDSEKAGASEKKSTSSLLLPSSSCFFFYLFCCGVPEMSPVVDDGLNTSGGIHDLRQSTMRMPTRSELYRFFCLTVIDRTTSLFTKVSFRT
jgi:hypothetical protein